MSQNDGSSLLTYYLHVCLSWSFILMQFCFLTWEMNILMQAMLNVLMGRIWPMGHTFPTLV